MRTARKWMLVAATAGVLATTAQAQPRFGGTTFGERAPEIGCGTDCMHARTVPGVYGPWGEEVPMAAPYNSMRPGAAAATAMMSHSIPMSMVQNAPGMGGSGVVQAGYCPGGNCGGPAMAMTPPGVPGLPTPGGMGGPPGAVAAVGALTAGLPAQYCSQRSSIRFVGPAGMRVSWFAPNCPPPGAPGAPKPGKGPFGTVQIEAPGRYNFVQGSIYRLKLSHIPNRPEVELYPTLEVVPTTMKTEAFLAHSSVPVNFTEEDLEQVAAGNFLVKVIYLPDPQFQDLASTGPDEVVSSRLEPGVDPIVEAHRRGSILAIVRLGNIDLEAPNTPAMDAPNPYAPRPMPAPVGPNCPPPYGAMMGNGLPPQMAGGMPGAAAMGGMSGMPGAAAMGGMSGMPGGISGPMMGGVQGGMMLPPAAAQPTGPSLPASPVSRTR